MNRIFLLFLLCGCASIEPQIPEPPPTVSTADIFVGYHEKRNRRELKTLLGVDPVNYEWCAAFVNSVLRYNDIPGSESVSANPLLARSFLDWGDPVDEPIIGDVIIFPRGNEGWKGHVGFYAGEVMAGHVKYYIILGGNQGNMVSYEYYRASTALGIRRYNGEQGGIRTHE